MKLKTAILIPWSTPKLVKLKLPSNGDDVDDDDNDDEYDDDNDNVHQHSEQTVAHQKLSMKCLFLCSITDNSNRALNKSSIVHKPVKFVNNVF